MVSAAILAAETAFAAITRAGNGRERAAKHGENGLNTPAGGYNPVFYSAVRTIMEAEQLNTIANRLADLAQRTAELRRYL